MTDASAATSANLAADAPESTPKPPLSAREEAVDTVRFLAILAVVVLVFRSFFLSPFNIPSESMQPRLLIGDYLLVNKMAYGYTRYSLPFSVPLIPGRVFGRTPQRGDVVVFKPPGREDQDWIKRVIGVPGDTVQVSGGIVWLNGAPLKRQQIADFVTPVTPNMIDAKRQEFRDQGLPVPADSLLSPCYSSQFEEPAPGGGSQCRYPQFREWLPGGKSYSILDLADFPVDDTPLVVVPDGHVFLMGDNRDRSSDSRVAYAAGGLGGPVPVDHLVGHALVGMFSTDGSASWINPISWVTAARWSRIGEGF